MPAFFVTWIFADHPYFGRRRSLIMSFGCCSFCMAILLFVGYSYLIPLAAVAKFFIGMSFIISYQFTLELYETHNRVTGLGSCSGVGRLGGIIMPIVSIYGSTDNLMFPYIIFGITGMISFIALMTIDAETQGKQLDQKDEEAELLKGKDVQKYVVEPTPSV